MVDVADLKLQPLPAGYEELYADAQRSREAADRPRAEGGLPPDVVPLTPEDLYACALLLQAWLNESEQLFLFDLPADEARMWFLRFVVKYNSGAVDAKYWLKRATKVDMHHAPHPIADRIGHHSQFTRYEWPHTREPMRPDLAQRMEEAMAIVERMTNEAKFDDLPETGW